MSYRITTSEAQEGLFLYGPAVGYVTDALTGRTVASFKSPTGRWLRVPLDTDLCDGCDEPVEDCRCDPFDSLPVRAGLCDWVRNVA